MVIGRKFCRELRFNLAEVRCQAVGEHIGLVVAGKVLSRRIARLVDARFRTIKRFCP
jgi:hypothetical protein